MTGAVDDAVLEVRGLAAPFGDRAGAGVRDASFAVRAGERLAIVGPSGAGKTTLLRAIAGLHAATAGTVLVRGRDVTALPPERRDAVYLHQTPVLFPHLTVHENVAFPLRVRGAGAAEVRERVRRTLDAVHLAPDEFGPRAPHALSGGQRHRVALARAVAARPAALLLDEPLAALDPSLRAEVRQAIAAAQAESGAAVVLVTHDLDEAGLLADRIAVLLDGRIAQTAAPAELFARPASVAVARFLGIPNVVAGAVRAGIFRSPCGAVACDAAGRRDGPATAAFRADAALARAAGPVAEVTDGARGGVRDVRHRTAGSTVLVALGDLLVECAHDALAPPAAGVPVRVAIDPRRVHVVSDEG